MRILAWLFAHRRNCRMHSIVRRCPPGRGNSGITNWGSSPLPRVIPTNQKGFSHAQSSVALHLPIFFRHPPFPFCRRGLFLPHLHPQTRHVMSMVQVTRIISRAAVHTKYISPLLPSPDITMRLPVRPTIFRCHLLTGSSPFSLLSTSVPHLCPSAPTSTPTSTSTSSTVRPPE